MAVGTPSPLLGMISGNIQSTCFSQSRAGLVIRKKQRRTGEQSAQVITAQTRFRQLSDYWSMYSDEQRLAWANIASSLSWPSRTGVQRRPTPREAYLSWAMDVYTITGTLSMDIPQITYSNTPTITAIDYKIGAWIRATVSILTPPANDCYAFYVSRYFPPGRTSQPRSWRCFARFSAPVSMTMNLYPSWVAMFGTSATADETVAIAVKSYFPRGTGPLPIDNYPPLFPSVRTWTTCVPHA